MTRYKILMVMCLAACLISCGKEDSLVAIPDTLTDIFAPAPGATDEESELRRSFYSAEQSYLLFNDTLRHEVVSTAPDGSPNYRTELLDIDYTLGNDKNVVHNEYDYTFLSSIDDKKAAVEVLTTYITGYFPKGMAPFSWLLVETIKMGRKSPFIVNGQRSTALAMGQMLELDEEGKKAKGLEVVSTILSTRMSDESLEPFYRISADYYNKRIGYNMPDYYDKGFIVKGTYGRGPAKADDVKSYLTLLFSKNLQEIADDPVYKDYPLIQQKAQLISAVALTLGLPVKK